MSSFLIRTPVPDVPEPVVASAVAFKELAVVARTTYNAGVYDRKFAAFRKSTTFVAFGAANLVTNSVSLVTKVAASIGPHLNCPTAPPMVVPVACTDATWSDSVTFTPGETRLIAILFSLIKILYLCSQFHSYSFFIYKKSDFA
jgi:hypothetical protein